MTPNEMQRLVMTQSGILAPRMYEGVASALADANTRTRGYKSEIGRAHV